LSHGQAPIRCRYIEEHHVPAETYTFFGYSHDVQVLIFCNISLTFLCPGYIGEFEEIDDHRSGKIVVQLNGRLNKCGVISPRYNVKLGDLEKWVVKLLPARQFGYVILTTSAGIMDHEEARRKHVSGKVIGFFY
jgi:small subunit ribosomal protein S15Ae